MGIQTTAPNPRHHAFRISRRGALGCLGFGALVLFTLSRSRQSPAPASADDPDELGRAPALPLNEIPNLPVTLMGTPEVGARNGFVVHTIAVFDVPRDGELRITTVTDASHVAPGNVAGLSLRPDPAINPKLELVWSRRTPPGGVTPGAYLGHHGLGRPAEYHYLGDTNPVMSVDVLIRHDHAVFTHNGKEIVQRLRSSLFEARGGRLLLLAYVQGGPDSQATVNFAAYSGADLI